MKVQCKQCGGKGYLWDWIGLSMLTVMAPLVYFIERNDPDSPNKEKCTKCNGKGWIKV